MASTSTVPGRSARDRVPASLTGTDPVGHGLPLVALVVMFLYAGHLNPAVFSYLGLDLLLSSAVPLVLAAIAQSFIIALGDIDLGVGYAVGLANCAIAVTLTSNVLAGVGILVAIVAAYALQGYLITVRGVPPITFTLGASFVWLGVAQVIAPTPSGTAPAWLATFFEQIPPAMPPSAWLIIAATIATYLIYFRTRLGLMIRAAGSNDAAFRSGGSSLVRTRVAAYCLSAVFVILAGLAVTGVTGSGDATASADYTLLTIAGVILGGAAFSGGKMSAAGVVAGALVLSLVGSVMAQLNVSSSLQTGAEGVILVAAIAGRRFLSRRSR